jgi:8-oxo-dGTP diphosphatase
MAREPVVAAGGIVLRREQPPRIAVVRLRKRDEWVLPKGKLDRGETARDAAEREVLEETGHEVTVHEFLGTLAYESGGRSKIVHYWRMEADGEQAYELMHDVRAVDWLPLDVAVGRLSRSYERAFLTHVGPYALEAASGVSRRPKAKTPVRAPAAKRRPSRTTTPKPPVVEPVPAQPSPMLEPRPAAEAYDVIEAEPVAEVAEAVVVVQTEAPPPLPSDSAVIPEAVDETAALTADGQRRSLAQKVRDWLRRAA